MRSTKVFLFSTPLSLIPAPLLGVPVLQGYLSSNGVDCNSCDLNIRFMHWLLNDRTLLDGFAADTIKEFKQIQQLPALTQHNAVNLMQSAAAMSLIPPEIIDKHFGAEAVLGLSEPTALSKAGHPKNPWEDQMPCWATALGMLGLVPNDLGGVISEQKASENRQVSFNTFLNTQEVKTILHNAAECDVVGISTSFWLQQKEYAYRLAKEIRRLNPKAFIILGGSGLTIMAEYSKNEIMESGVVDAVGLYQGELTLRMLAEYIAKGEEIDKVPDLILFNHEKRSYKYTEHLPTVHPDSLPTPVYNQEELEMYHKLAGTVLPDKRAPLMISRGCYWDKCAFCSDSQCRHPETSPHEVRNPEKVLEDIEKLQKLHGISYFYLITSAMSPSWGKRFARGVIERGIKAKFWAYTRALGKEAADSEYFQLLKKAGFDVITCGVESTVDRVLTAISKGNSRAEITNTIQGLSKAGVRTKFNLIADIPPSTYEDAKSNWDYVIDNLPYINDLSVFTFLLHLGSEMADNPEKFNIKVVTEKDGSIRELFPGTIAHTNPFYENSRAKEIVQRTKNLSNDLQFFQLTQAVRNTIDSADFSWKDSTILFRPFTAIPSKFPLYDVKQRDVYIVTLSNMFNYIVIPAAFADFMELYKQGVLAPVSFEKLLQAFEAGMGAQKREGIAQRMLDRMAREGFILDIKMSESQSEKQDTESIKSDLHKSLPRAYGRYPSTERPFEFGTFPFAMVLSTLMI